MKDKLEQVELRQLVSQFLQVLSNHLFLPFELKLFPNFFVGLSLSVQVHPHSPEPIPD